VDAVALRQRGGGVEERALRAAEAVDQQHVGAGAHRERRDAAAGQAYVVDAQQRLATVLLAEHALEGDRQIEVAARVQQPPAEGVDARQLAAAQGDPGVRVGADHDVGRAAGRAPAGPRAVGGAAYLPRVPDVSEHDPPGRIEAGLGAEIALRKRAKPGLDRCQSRGVGGWSSHRQPNLPGGSAAGTFT
jgi:hypothetical protein